MEQAQLKDKPALTLHRKFPVAPEKVWRAWTEPQALKQWFGPAGEQQPVSVADIDLRPGGRFRLAFGGPDGNEHEAAGVYKEVQPYSKLVFSWCWPRTTPDRISQVTILLRPEGKGTDMEFRHDRYRDFENEPTHEEGWNGALDKLETHLQGG